MSVNQQKGSEKEPTREELIEWYNDQIEIAELRHKLTVLQSETVQAEAMRLEALAVMAKYQQAPQEEKDSESVKLEDEVEV
tara:strand:+ start:1076 stop:1318 length:243 start_codon:yes stop_codon:yes gene_type:complete